VSLSFALPKNTGPERNWLPLRHKGWRTIFRTCICNNVDSCIPLDVCC